MAIVVNFYNFSKDTNSTARPDALPAAPFACEFTEPFDILAPTIKLQVSDPRNSDGDYYNYCYIPHFKRYYFIDGWTYRDGLWYGTTAVDVLASYKTEIGATPLYILRSSATSDGRITDNYYLPLAQVQISKQLQDLSTVPWVNFNYGVFLVHVMGMGSAAGGAEFIYQLTPGAFKLMIDKIYTAIDGFQLSDVWNNVVQKFGGNPQELISGVVWVPYSFPGVAISDIKIGSFSTGISGEIVTDNQIDLVRFTYSIPKHPKAASKGVYLNIAPFSEYLLDINCGGIVQLDTTKLLNVDTINIDRTLDVKGQVLTIVHTNEYEFARVYGQMGVAISINGNNSGGSVLTSIISTIGSATAAYASGGASALAGASAAGIGNIINAAGGAASNSSSGGIAGIGEPGKLCASFYDIPDEDNARNGRPLCKVRTPASLGGFMIAQRGDVAIAGMAAEADQLRGLLEGGFYYE